ncbi:MAG: tetratricopeptide repeat protein [Dehalococcoidia bacterium]|nr:tetratricopeptide repeat protein [Dehalococcoidia bacterium]
MRPGKALRTTIAFLAVAFSVVFTAQECSQSDRDFIYDFLSSYVLDATLTGKAGADDVKNAMDVKDAYNRVTAQQNYDRANQLKAKGDKQGALEALNEAIRLDPNAPQDFYRNRAELLHDMGNDAAAVEDYDKALTAAEKRAPKSPYVIELYQERARSRNASGDYQGAVDDLNYVIRNSNRGEDPELLAQRAAAKQNLGDTSGAKDDLDRAVAAKPNDPGILQQRAEINRAQGRTQEAISDYDKAMQNVSGPTFKDAKKIDELAIKKSQLQADKGDYRAAAASMDAAQKAYEERNLKPPSDLFMTKGDFLRAAAAGTNDPNAQAAARDQAIAAYSGAIDGGRTAALGSRAETLNDKAMTTQNPTERNNLLGRAYQDADQHVKAFPENPYGPIERGKATFAANYFSASPSASTYADAIKDFRTAADRAGNSTNSAYWGEQSNSRLGDASFNRGLLTGSRADYERARDGFQAAIRYNPNNPNYHEGLAQTSDKLGERELASAARGRADQLRRQGRPPA